MSLSCAAQQLTKENETHWAKGKIANNIRQCSFVHLLSLPKEKYLHMIYQIATFPAKHALKKWGSSIKEVHFPYKASTSTKKDVVICKLAVAFELVKCIFRKKSFCEGWIMFKKYVLSTTCIVFYNAIFLSASFIMVTFFQADAVFF